ncbi:MOSC domain-containing protein [Stieleria sp. TO1_6]|uniref:MOSC domain-containing protein n=1 Tax=Stieleria tagensis TaxID=2956795 RepID=UPI00209AF66E|nr:MOSC domain-containing protein [Stieleria tagensis]MCO8122272.1 MOSC domain-containing protein [Stieleria tagensis]
MITIKSVQVGKVVTEGAPDASDLNKRQWTSAFRKCPIEGPVQIGPLGIEGDQVADSKNHGGPEKAVLCYAGAHYDDWQREHPELEFGGGGFGENLTLNHLTEAEACVGDQWSNGSCILEISQPRQPCWKISRRWKTKTMTKEVTQTGRTGWYVRVLQAGVIAAADELTLLERPHPDWTVARANDVLFGREVDRMAVHELMNLPALSQQWKEALS